MIHHTPVLDTTMVVDTPAEKFDKVKRTQTDKEVSKKKTPDEDDGFWSDISPAKVAAAPKGRSIFSDVDD